MYHRERETNSKAAAEHNRRQRTAAADRLKGFARYNKAKKSGKLV